MNILHVSISPRGQASESHRLSRKIVDYLTAIDPGAHVVNRVIDGSLPHVDANYALGQHTSAVQIATDGSVARSDELIDELERAHVVVIGTPMHNSTIPSALKAWIDHVVRARRTFHVTPQGKIGALRDRPVYIAVASGGRYSGDRAYQPDFLTSYLTFILGMIGLRDLRFFSVQGTGLGSESLIETIAATDRELHEHFAASLVDPFT